MVIMRLKVKESSADSFDIVSLGEVMLRLDPGDRRIHTAEHFDVWEGGGEYNVTKAASGTFGLRTAVLTAFVDNPIGHLLLGRIRSSGVDTRYVRFLSSDCGLRNGLNFTERGFGVRGALGVSDRQNTAASHIRLTDFDWDEIFSHTRWLHTGGIFAALSDDTAQTVLCAVQAAKRHGVIVSYDLNYRPSLWQNNGGQSAARAVNRSILPYVDVLLGNETDYYDALGVGSGGSDSIDAKQFARSAERVLQEFPKLSILATSLRTVHSASENDWSGAVYADGQLIEGSFFSRIDVYDRVGGGDCFASGLIYGLLENMDLHTALRFAVAHGALAMTTPGDTSMATLREVRALAQGADARIIR